jgi:hypothetical protein
MCVYFFLISPFLPRDFFAAGVYTIENKRGVGVKAKIKMDLLNLPRNP